MELRLQLRKMHQEKPSQQTEEITNMRRKIAKMKEKEKQLIA